MNEDNDDGRTPNIFYWLSLLAASGALLWMAIQVYDAIWGK